ncbi:unnamed protein product [Rotaria magnacalcarata]|uniref:AIG1-type G domain-containing protein n=1 Tax=Rotaria magnacalcarata TaxID=392030 RepID=A0A815HEK3_9BILA|nr:unnamed protein product [Rotaria magnacalcarata]CAF4255199.1 unnamed protein product [Rotaria magnacalcarata]
MNDIKADYETDGRFHVTRAEPRNIMLIERTRTGKSTIKSLLVDPTVVPTDLTLKSDSRDPLFETFHVSDNKIVLNIIDTPGLFEHGDDEMKLRDNDAILNTIEVCVNRGITKFHVVCFCAAVTAGLNREDIDSLRLLVKFLGDEISKNSCLIITRCESKDEQQREKMSKELSEDIYFKEIAPFFKLGIYFSGSLNPDDYNKANESLYDQYSTISDYRIKLIELFTSSIEPFPLSELLISEVRRAHEKKVKSIKDDELQEMRSQTEKQAEIIEELRVARLDKKRDIAEIIDRLTAISLPPHEQHNCSQGRYQELEKCLIS